MVNLNKVLNTDLISELIRITDNAENTNHINYLREDFLIKTLEKRTNETNCGSIDQYLELLKTSPGEVKFLQLLLNNTYSGFFRNPLTFAVLESVVLPAVLKKALMKKRKEIRIWSAASAGGHEPFSLAILLSELQALSPTEFTYRIFATDINTSQIEDAKKGVFTPESLDNVSLKRLSKWFIKTGNYYRVHPVLQQNIDFSQFDLFDSGYCCPPTSIFGDFDVLMCANVLLYYNDESRKIIFNKILKSLADKGYLITGEAENGLVANYPFIKIMAPSAIFQVMSKSAVK